MLALLFLGSGSVIHAMSDEQDMREMGGLYPHLKKTWAMMLIGTLALAAIIWYGGGQIIHGALTFRTLVAFLEYTTRFFAPIRDLAGFYAEMLPNSRGMKGMSSFCPWLTHRIRKGSRCTCVKEMKRKRFSMWPPVALATNCGWSIP